MTDYFALLEQPRSPWLDAAAVESAFLQASKAAHPDRVHGADDSSRRAAHERTVEINRAHLCLKDVRLRLRHFLELERGTSITDLQEIPEALMTAFMEVAQQLKAADAMIARGSGLTSPMLKVEHLVKVQQLQPALEDCKTRVQTRHTELKAALQKASAVWTEGNALGDDQRERVLSELENLYRLITFHERWIEQIETRSFKLMSQV